MTLDRRGACLALGAAALESCASLPGGRAEAEDVLLFAYFSTGKGERDGLKLAVSEDGFAFRPLRGGAPVLVPQVGEAKLLRDPFVFRGEGRDAPYHAVWTSAWDGVTIGHATTRDFVTWTPQRALPVMAGVAGTRNCWAPEAIYDPARRCTVLFWSSTVEGRFAETAGTSENGYNHRLWYTTTSDFEDFAVPQVLYDPGFSVIDGTFARAPGGGLWLVVKDETVTPPRKWLRAASAGGPLGPFAPLGAPFSPGWVEGPMTVRLGDALVCYFDVYRDGRWGAAITRDMVRWEDVSARLDLPQGARHGSLVRVGRALVERIEAA
ncbi:glycoside hydrolase family 43 protein [Novosphingobium sp. 1949]|uniref:Glycoside hydrolase family 43 protein n=1 Tax=Novosphingobium organovorum TaxID=2930092 RepID=A0ABT0BD50_9SPHN|nr:glycoside hydrolase family 43 protein [Novosphingobium organovorum]MCJ2182918.1 glycoside hydrolase family 43 protein [Novosphingobium organovorum]